MIVRIIILAVLALAFVSFIKSEPFRERKEIQEKIINAPDDCEAYQVNPKECQVI